MLYNVAKIALVIEVSKVVVGASKEDQLESKEALSKMHLLIGLHHTLWIACSVWPLHFINKLLNPFMKSMIYKWNSLPIRRIK